MPAVTQLNSNYLGGVSKQIDSKKLMGQVDEVINGIADATFGMQKRKGFRHVATLAKDDGTAFTKADLEDAQWFFAQQSGDQYAYYGCVTSDGLIYMFNAITPDAEVIVNYPADPGYNAAAFEYLKGERLHFLTIQDTTIITNRDTITEMQPDEAHTSNLVGTIVLTTIDYGVDYTVILDGTEYTYRTPDGYNPDSTDPDIPTEKLTSESLLNSIYALIPAKYKGAGAGVYKTSIELVSSTPFTLEVKAGITGVALNSYQDTVDNISKLPAESYDGRKVKVSNASGAEDDYYLKFTVVRNPNSDDENIDSWKECRGFGVSPGVKEETFPWELVAVGLNEFNLLPQEWDLREAGDDTTNPGPSFIGKPVSATFFYNNRFGMLSEGTVFMSQANDPKNLFATSAITAIDSDPIDVDCSSTKPTDLFAVLSCPQGLQLFARREQFLLTGDGTTITPANVMIRRQSNYEMNININPEDMGVRDVFVSRVPGYTRVFTMQQRGVEETPAVVDISKVVNEYIPFEINRMAVSPQNSMILLTDRHEPFAYCYKYYNNGEDDLFQSWTKWTLPGNPQYMTVLNDMVLTITQQSDQYTVLAMSLNDLPFGPQFSDDPGLPVSSALDMWARPGGYFDTATGETVFEVNYNAPPGMRSMMVFTPPYEGIDEMKTLFDLVSPFSAVVHPDPENATGYYQWLDESTGEMRLKGDWTNYSDRIVVGYAYDFEVEFPTFYMNIGNGDQPVYDYTAALTVSRCKFSVGKSGSVTFKLKSRGSEEWHDIEHTTIADYYNANYSPVLSENVFTVPIHQRNMNFKLKLTSELPFPVSLVSMMWEGMYTPRFYRRS